jgi:hypothetical protein
MNMEIWKSVVGSKNRYEVSSLGRVRSNRSQNKPPKVLRRRFGNGYPRHNIYFRGVMHTIFVHTLVLEAFRGPRPPGLQAAHLNGNKHDCALRNLIWATPQENNTHKIEHGTVLRGEKHPFAKLTNADVRCLRELRANGVIYRKLGERFGITLHGAWDVVHRTWNHL